MHSFKRTIINYLIPVTTFPGDTKESIDVHAAGMQDVGVDGGNSECPVNMGKCLSTM